MATATKTRRTPAKISTTKKSAKTISGTGSGKTANMIKAATSKKAATKKKSVVSGTTANGNGPGHRGVWGEFNEHGLRKGSDVAVILDVLLKGGADRQAINDQVAKSLKNPKTRGGYPKNIPSLVSGVITKMVERGYSIESSYKMHPPKPGAKTKTSTASKTAKPVAKKAVAKVRSNAPKAPARKTATKAPASKPAAVKRPVTSGNKVRARKA